MDWLKVVASPELQIPTDVTQGGLFARTDIDPTEFPDPIRQELQKFVAENPGKLILDQHGSILPATAQPIYWDILSSFLVRAGRGRSTIQAVADMMTTYDVKDGFFLVPVAIKSVQASRVIHLTRFGTLQPDQLSLKRESYRLRDIFVTSNPGKQVFT